MSNTNTPGRVNFEYKGKSYCLEFSLDTIMQMEAAGFRRGDLGVMPATRIKQLWAGAFMKNHRRDTSSTIIEELYGEMKGREKLLQTLAEMYSSALSNLMPDAEQGNVEWTASP